jgi:hypothetical protein
MELLKRHRRRHLTSCITTDMWPTVIIINLKIFQEDFIILTDVPIFSTFSYKINFINLLPNTNVNC